MVIASIDLMKGKAVQLVGGREKVLEREDPLALAREFDTYGEVAVIDLDAALGQGENQALIGELCRSAQCRVGGGIRTVEQARLLVSQGAKKIIVGSQVFPDNQLNTSFLQSLGQAIGKERIIVAVDAWEGQIVTRGWANKTGLNLYETVRQLAPMVSEILFTCVEREGRLAGTDIDAVTRLRQIYPHRITVAGGIHTIEEIGELSRLGVDVQLGMALYTGKITLADAFIASLNWKTPLLPVITRDEEGQVLMLAYTDAAALQKTFASRTMWYFSRSKERLWQKGETSGNNQQLLRLRTDCDRDSLLATVIQKGVACHGGEYSCFGEQEFNLTRLYHLIGQRFAQPVPGSYTATLTREKVREKLLEEAQEVVEAQTRDEILWEAADLLYFLTVLMQKEGVTFPDVLRELYRRRHSPRRQEQG